MIKDVIKLIKPKHHVKNLVVLIPLIFSLKFLNLTSTLHAFIAMIAFCLVVSAVYVFNDIIDVDSDKLHPIKKFRPIASGKVGLKLAWSLMFTLVFWAFVLSLTLNLYVFLSVFAYLILNIWYSLQLKYLPIIDVMCIALGFILRILAGCGAILVIPSPLVILLTFFTSMFFTFSKRKMEYSLLQDKNNCRKSIKEYNEEVLNHYVSINAILSIAFYFTYMLDPQLIARANTPYLYITVIPFAMIIFRLLLKVYTCTSTDDPADFIYKDKTFVVLSLIFLLILFILLIA